MLKIFEHISTRESLKERSQEGIRRTQAKMEKKLRRRQEKERFILQRQAVNDAVFQRKDQCLLLHPEYDVRKIQIPDYC